MTNQNSQRRVHEQRRVTSTNDNDFSILEVYRDKEAVYETLLGPRVGVLRIIGDDFLYLDPFYKVMGTDSKDIECNPDKFSCKSYWKTLAPITLSRRKITNIVLLSDLEALAEFREGQK